MNHYLHLTVKEKSTGFIGMVISVDGIMELLGIQFSFGVKWLKEDEIEIIDKKFQDDADCLNLACENYREEMEKNLADATELEKENSRLNQIIVGYEEEITDLRKDCEEYSKTFNRQNNEIISLRKKIIKAIEIIEGLMRFCRCFAQHHTEDIRYKEAEKFLKGVRR